MPRKRLLKEAYTVAWICALPVPELKASRLLFDGEEHENVILGHNTTHQYVFGEMNGHNVVMGCLPESQMGKASAASVATEMLSTFPGLRFALIVGIGGGVPGPNDIRLGDVVVGLPNHARKHGGVVQYDFGKAMQNGEFVKTGQLNQPPWGVLSGLSKLQSAREKPHTFTRHLDTYKKESCWKPGRGDRLFNAAYKHIDGRSTCGECNSGYELTRPKRLTSKPYVHYGLIASGDQVMKDAVKRDALSQQYDGILCFEMEAAGVANILPCLVIRGICDYCDSHKNDEWQPFAAAAAAAWGKELLGNITPMQSRGSELVRLQDQPGTQQEKWLEHLTGQLGTAKNSVDDVRNLINRISSYEPRRILNRFYRKRWQGTTEWLTSAPEFIGWESDDTKGNVLWLSGKVGSGKTVAMTTAVHHLVFAVQALPNAKIIHHFLQYPDTKAMDLFRSLSRQLVQFYIDGNKPCPSELVQDLDLHFGDDNRSPDLDELVDDIMLPLTDGMDTLIVCIDGIDINEEREQQYIWNGIRKLLRRRRDRQKATKILVTAENESKLATLLPNSTLRIRLDNGVISSDIELYINARLQEHSHPRHLFHNTFLREKVRNALFQRAENMFLWVHIQLDEILDCETLAEVDSALQDLPTDLSDLYVRCLGRKSKQRLLCNPKILKWCSAAREPLRVDDLRDMLALDLDTGDVASNERPSQHSVIRSGVSLLTLEEAEMLLEPAHHSVRQFLFSDFARTCLARDTDFDEDFYQKLSMPMDDAEREIGRLCLCHIRAKTGLEVQTRDRVKAPPVIALIPRFVQKGLGLGSRRGAAPRLPVLRTANSSGATSLLQYAIKNWVSHTTNFAKDTPGWIDFQTVALEPNASWALHPWPAAGHTPNSHLRGLLGYAVAHAHQPLLQLLVNKPALLPKSLYDQVLPGNGLLPALHVAAKLGLVDLIPTLLKLCSINGLSPHGRKTALHVALEHGQDHFATSLCAFPGAPVDVLDAEGVSPLALALRNGHIGATRALFADSRVHFNSEDDSLTAAERNECSFCESILRGTGEVNSRRFNGETPLHDAVFLTTAKLLLASGVDVDARDKYERTPLHGAVRDSKTRSIVQLLLDNQANVHAKDHQGRTPLHETRDEIVTKLLLANGAEVRAKDHDGQTPLHLSASPRVDEGVVTLLLENCADVHAKDENGRTPLHNAAADSSATVVKLLLDKQANVRAKDNNGLTPLHNARLESVAKLLLANGADVNAKDHEGSTPLHLAIAGRRGMESVAKLLLASGADVDAKRNEGSTPLHIAAKISREGTQVTQLLIRNRADVNAKDHQGSTPLHIASADSMHSDGSVIKELVGNRADVNAKDHEGSTPLHIATAKSGESVAKLLIENRADVDAENHQGLTPLHLATGRSGESVAKLLIGNRANLYARSNEGRTPLHEAAFKGSDSIVRLLLQKNKTVVNARDYQQATPLHLAAIRGHRPVVEQLLAVDNAEVDVRNSDGYTPLHYAASRRYDDVVELLVDTGRAHVDLRDDSERMDSAKTPSALVRSGDFDELRRLLEIEAEESNSQVRRWQLSQAEYCFYKDENRWG